MPEENAVQEDVKQEVAPDSSPEAKQQEVANPPTGENPAANSAENRVPQTRFNEVIEQRNRERELRETYEARIRELESRQVQASNPRNELVEGEVKRLVSKLQMSEEAARELVTSQMNIAAANRVELESQQRRFRAEEWARQKASSDPVYREIEPELDRSFSSLSPQMKAIVSSDPEALEMFYESVKSKHSGVKAKEAFSKGQDEAYKNKSIKASMSSMPGTSASSGKVPLSRKSVAAMSEKEYVARQDEINEAVKNGSLK